MPYVAPRVDLERPLPSIGHNGGPPFEQTFRGFAWRKAHAKAWRTPPREIALARLARAERIGLTYRDYQSVLMDRGVNLSAVVLAPGVLKAMPKAAVREKLAAIRGATLFVCLDPRDLVDADWLVTASEVIRASRADLAAVIVEALSDRLLPPLAAFLVGTSDADRAIAEMAGLPLYKPAAEYFAGA
ncbi:hypothetical protein [Desertibaculum subflavum]|uniref:hypothetical protein n=1 Tax=Desertibaculum subflavum TaxID=2268458 RepID=UPI0034D191C8